MCSPALETEDCRRLAEFLAVLSHPVRIRMLCALQSGRMSVSELAKYAEVSMSNASQHLRAMRDKGIVGTTRNGQHVFYEIVDSRFLQGVSLIRKAMLEMARRQGEQAASFAETALVENRES